MDKTPPPIRYAQYGDSPGSGSLMGAAILCFLGSLVPLAWLALQGVNLQPNQLQAAIAGARLPFGLLLLEDAACALALSALLIGSGVLLCLRARWAIHVTGAVMGVVLVGATGVTVAEAIRRFSDRSPIAKPVSDHIVELTVRVAVEAVWPLAVVLLLSRPSVRAEIVSRRGSMPATPVLLFVAGVVLSWYGLAATSMHEQAVPMQIYFGRFYSATAVTLWRVGFAAAWVLAGVLMLRAKASGWVLAVLVTLAAIASETLLAAIGGSGALTRETFSRTADQLGAALAMGSQPNAPWLAALSRSATAICLLGLLLLAAQHFLFEDVPDAPNSSSGHALGADIPE